MSIVIKQGDTRHALQAVLKDVNNQPVDLSSAQVDFFMQSRRGVVLISREAQQTETAGEVWMVFEDGETDIPDFYRAEFKVRYLDGKIETFPHTGALKITIESTLGG